MREEPTRSLLLLDANPEERRLISAIAGRAGWSVVGAADEEMALALLQGPHGREVQAALLGSWDPEKGPQMISALREDRPNLPVIVVSQGDDVSVAVEAIRAASLRAKGPLLSLDCKAVAANIIDSELFGHEKGAFPGAFTAKTGKLVQADGGTLVLDEIGVLPAETQEMLDRVLATGEVR